MEGKGTVLNSELDLFREDPLEGQMEVRETLTLPPLSNEYSSNITFDIRNDQDQCYIDSSRIYLEADVGIQKYNATSSKWVSIAKDDKIFPINNLLHSMFKDVEVQLNGKVINENNGTYPFLAYLTFLLSYGENYLECQGKSFGWIKDTAGEMDTVDVAADSPRLGRHMKFIDSGDDTYHDQVVLGRLVGEVFQQERYLPHRTDLRIVLRRTSDAFLLMGENAGKQRLVIKTIVFHVDYVKIDPTLYLQHKTLHLKQNMIIPIRRRVIKTFNIPSGTYTQTINTLFTDVLPQRLVLCMTTNQAFIGAHNKNPFNFGHFGLTELKVNYGGRYVPKKPYKPDFGKERYTRSYMSLFQGTDKLDKNEDIPITYEEYPDGFTMWCYDFTADNGGADNVLHTTQKGTLTIDVTFGTALTAAVTLLAYAEYENKLEIDHTNNVYSNY